MCAVLPAIVPINKISAASIPQSIEGTITEQAIKILRICVLVTGEIFAFPIRKKGIMPHLYPSEFYELQPCFVQSIMSRPHAFVKAGEFSCARRVKILLHSKAAYAIFTTIPGSVRARSDKFIWKTTGASDCGFPQNRRVKGKQVQILCDLVTVIGECETMRFCAVTDRQVCWEGCLMCRSISQETCRSFGTGA